MKFIVVAVGTRMPNWVTDAWLDYARRLPSDYALELKEVKPEPRRSGKTPAQMMQAEAARLLNNLPPDAITVALDERGRDVNTVDVFNHLQEWRTTTNHVVFFIGGPDGLDEKIKQQAHMRWRLSSMTLPHPLVRVVLAEQLYRAWAIMTNHPYHRA